MLFKFVTGKRLWLIRQIFRKEVEEENICEDLVNVIRKVSDGEYLIENDISD